MDNLPDEIAAMIICYHKNSCMRISRRYRRLVKDRKLMYRTNKSVIDENDMLMDLYKSVINRDSVMVKFLLEYGCVATMYFNTITDVTPIDLALELECLDIVNLLLIRKGNMKYNNSLTKFEKWVIAGKMHMIELCYVNVETYNLLPIACLFGHINLVNLFISMKVNLNQVGRCGYTPLRIAAANGHTEIVELLIHAGAHVDTTHNNSLVTASWNGYTNIAKILLDHHADVNSQNLDGWTPMMVAVNTDNLELVKLLIHYNIDYTKTVIRDSKLDPLIKKGDNVFSIARKKNRREAFEIIRQHLNDPNLKFN
jgi:ankyrin repeat protein